MPAKNEREYRNMIIEVKDASDERDIVEGYATTFNSPYVLYKDADVEISEQVDRHAFDDADMDDVIMQYDHQGRVFARKSNNTLTVMPDDTGLLINADLGGTTIGRQLYEEIKGGYTNKMSFGFKVADDDWDDEKGEDGVIRSLRTILKIEKLYDVSAVSLPANDQTSISARNISDGAIKRLKAERLEAQRKAALAELEERVKKLKEIES